MSDRIRNLEQAVETLQSNVSSQPHPLLASDLLQIKSALGLYGGTQKGMDHLNLSVTTGDQVEQDKSLHEDPEVVEQSVDHLPSSVRLSGDQLVQDKPMHGDMDVMEQLSSDEPPTGNCHPEVNAS